MILVITPNPAIDRTLVLPSITPGESHRVERPIIAAGGKGLNVARAIHILGGRAAVGGFLGGHSGSWLAELAAADGLIEGRWTRISGETRTCVIFIDKSKNEATVINETGPQVSGADWQNLQADVLSEAAQAGVVCLSGSLPPGSPLESFTGLLAAMQRRGLHVWVDTSGPALAAAAGVPGIGIKVNESEAGVILGRAVRGVREAAQAAQALHSAGVAQVALTLGREGALFIGADGECWRAASPDVPAVSAVGSGDCFLAGLVTALEAGSAPAEALRRATTAGTANTLTAGGGSFTLAQYAAVLEQVRIEKVSKI